MGELVVTYCSVSWDVLSFDSSTLAIKLTIYRQSQPALERVEIESRSATSVGDRSYLNELVVSFCLVGISTEVSNEVTDKLVLCYES